MTVRAMAVGDGSAGIGTAQPVGVNTRAQARETPRSVTDRDRIRERRPGLVRRAGRIVWLDARDSWIAEERSPSAKTVWNTDYTAHLEQVWAPYRIWTRAYRPAAVAVALTFDFFKLLLINPLTGPLTLGAAALLYLIATH